MKELTDEELTSIWREANNFLNPEMSPPLSGRDSLFAAMRLAMEKARKEQKEAIAKHFEDQLDNVEMFGTSAAEIVRKL